MSRTYLAAAIVLEICGTTSLKLSDGFTRIGPSGAVVLCYLLSFALLGLALRGIELSIAYAVWSGIGTAVVAAIGIVWFGESAGGWKLLCLGLIVLGVVRGSTSLSMPRDLTERAARRSREMQAGDASPQRSGWSRDNFASGL
jgi:small multidrug resistance pump